MVQFKEDHRPVYRNRHDNIDIVMTELDALANVDFTTREVKPEHRTLNVLRIGTCGAIHGDIPLGSYIFSIYSVGCDGLLNWYANRDNVSNLDMEKAFCKHVHWDKHLPAPYFIKASDYMIEKFADCTVPGVTISASGFYGPQGRVVRLPLAMPNMLEDFESFRYGEYRITNFEMEGSALAGLAKQLGHNAGTVCRYSPGRGTCPWCRRCCCIGCHTASDSRSDTD